MQSDVDRDGMAMELMNGRSLAAEVFYSDQSHDFVLTTFQNAVPLRNIEELIEAAKTRLPAAN